MGVLLRQDAHREPRTPRSDLRELKEVLTSRRSCQIGRSGSNREAVPNRLSVCAYRGRGGRRFRPHGDAAHPALPAGALELAPRKPRRADAFEQIVEGSGSSGDGAETRMDGQTGHVTKAPERNPEDAPPAGRIGRCQRLALTHVPHQAAEVCAPQPGAWDAVIDGERRIVRNRSARLEHAPHDIDILLAVALAAHWPEPVVEAAQRLER